MTRSPRDEAFSAFVQTALARLYVAWPRVRRSGKQAIAYTWRIAVHAHNAEVRRPRWKREQYVAELPDELGGLGKGRRSWRLRCGLVDCAVVRAALAQALISPRLPGRRTRSWPETRVWQPT
jgi:hypothetical protein